MPRKNTKRTKKRKGKRRKTNGKVLVTGGAGYIGCVIVKELLDKGYAVKVLDTFYWGFDHLKHLEDKITIIQKDIREVNDDVF